MSGRNIHDDPVAMGAVRTLVRLGLKPAEIEVMWREVEQQRASVIQAGPPPDNRITQIKAWRESHRWGLAETKWLLERADVDFDLDRASEVVAGGYTEAMALADLRAAQLARRGTP